MKQCSIQCALGGFDFTNVILHHDEGEIHQFGYSTFAIDDATRRIMNRAARATEGVQGIKKIDSTKGTTFMLIIDMKTPGGKPIDLPATLHRWSVRFQEEANLIQRDEESGRTTVKYSKPALAEYAVVEREN